MRPYRQGLLTQAERDLNVAGKVEAPVDQLGNDGAQRNGGYLCHFLKHFERPFCRCHVSCIQAACGSLRPATKLSTQSAHKNILSCRLWQTWQT